MTCSSWKPNSTSLLLTGFFFLKKTSRLLLSPRSFPAPAAAYTSAPTPTFAFVAAPASDPAQAPCLAQSPPSSFDCRVHLLLMPIQLKLQLKLLLPLLPQLMLQFQLLLQFQLQPHLPLLLSLQLRFLPPIELQTLVKLRAPRFIAAFIW
jgi:hypothetical protein